jgi:hypothetical protein
MLMRRAPRPPSPLRRLEEVVIELSKEHVPSHGQTLAHDRPSDTQHLRSPHCAHARKEDSPLFERVNSRDEATLSPSLTPSLTLTLTLTLTLALALATADISWNVVICRPEFRTKSGA